MRTLRRERRDPDGEDLVPDAVDDHGRHRRHDVRPVQDWRWDGIRRRDVSIRQLRPRRVQRPGVLDPRVREELERRGPHATLQRRRAKAERRQPSARYSRAIAVRPVRRRDRQDGLHGRVPAGER